MIPSLIPFCPSSASRQPKGFTLLEILTAVVIFSVVLTTLYSSFRAVVFQADVIENRIDDYEMARNALDRIRSDLHALAVTPYAIHNKPTLSDMSEPDRFRFHAGVELKNGFETSTLSFVSFEHIPMGSQTREPSGRIHYYIKESENQTFELKRSDTGLLSGRTNSGDYFVSDTNAPALCSNVKKFSLIFRNSEGNTFETWDSDSKDYNYQLPSSVEIRLEIGKGESVRVFETGVSIPVSRQKKGES